MTTTLAQSGLSAAGKEGNEAIKRLNLLIYGPPGTWKTVTAHQMPRTRTLDFDDGMQSVEWAVLAGVIPKRLNEIVYETILPSTKKGVEEMIHRATDQVDEWIAEEDIPEAEWDRPYPQFWDTLIVDSASFLSEAAIELGLAENKALGLSKSLDEARQKRTMAVPMRMQDWGTAANIFSKAIRQWKALGKNLIVTAHQYENTNEAGVLTDVQPLVIGQLRQKLPAMFDEVYYTRIKGTKDKAEAIFQTRPDMLRQLKTRLGCLDAEEKGDFTAIRKKVAKFYGVPEERLWTAYHGSEGRAKAEEEEEKNAVTI